MLFRSYIRINFLLTLITILVTLAFFAIAAARHSTALTSCVALYGNTPAGSSSASSGLGSVGSTICNIFLWVQVGFMGLLIALIGLTQVSGLSSDLLMKTQLTRFIPAVHVHVSTSVWSRDAQSNAGAQGVS